jgi:hypothetical protein
VISPVARSDLKCLTQSRCHHHYMHIMVFPKKTIRSVSKIDPRSNSSKAWHNRRFATSQIRRNPTYVHMAETWYTTTLLSVNSLSVVMSYLFVSPTGNAFTPTLVPERRVDRRTYGPWRSNGRGICTVCKRMARQVGSKRLCLACEAWRKFDG